MMKRATSSNRVRSFNGSFQQQGKVRPFNREMLVICAGLIVTIPIVLLVRARSAATTRASVPAVSPLRGAITPSLNEIQVDLNEPEPVICSGPPTRALLPLPDPLATAQAEYARGKQEGNLADEASGLVRLLKDCHEVYLKEGGSDIVSKRETGDKSLMKKIQSCFLEASVADEPARRAVYESLYLAKVLKLYGTFRPPDLMIVKSEDLTPDSPSSAKQLQKAELHLTACQYKLATQPIKPVDEIFAGASHSLYEALVPWNAELSRLLGWEISWAPLAAAPAAAGAAAEKEGEKEQTEAPPAPATIPTAEEEKALPPLPETEEATTTVETRVLELINSSPVMIFSKSYCPYSRAAKSAMAGAGADMQVLELDIDPQGREIQDVLAKMTGRRTVPNVFVKGKTIGGGDETRALDRAGRLIPLLKEAKALKAED